MRIVRFEADGQQRVGYLRDGQVHDLSEEFESLSAFLEARMSDAEQIRQPGRTWPRAAVRWLAPIDPSARVFAIAQNYAAHAAEYGGPRPLAPVIFLKPSSSLAPPEADVELPAVSSFFDYEGELGAVIGRHGRNVPADRALEYIAGYTICDDGSARDLQDTILAGKPTIDWFSAKAIDNSSPVGPWIATRDEIVDPQNLVIQTRLNGESVQEDRTSSMVFSVAEQVAYISTRVAIRPGDLIATGTPAGVGKARGRALRPGDQLEIEIERIGILHIRFTAPAGPRS